jgi:AraC family transcriptional regulator
LPINRYINRDLILKDRTALWQSVFNFVESHIQTNLSLDDVAEKFNFSKFHVQREFSAHFGISLFKLVKLIRLKRGAYQLAFRKNESH